jgi:sec-independent protein translocase protein TatC
MATQLKKIEDEDEDREESLGGQMSFLEHLEEVRSRLTRSIVFVFVVFFGCFFVSQYIFNFLSIPIRRALAEAQQRQVKVQGLKGDEQIVSLNSGLKEGDSGRFVFNVSTNLGSVVIPPGASVQVKAVKEADGKISLFTDEPIYTNDQVIPKGIKLPLDLQSQAGSKSADDKLIVTTIVESFSLYLKVSLYAAIALSVPFLLWQIWGFISPGLYPHERGYVTPFVSMSSVSFIIGAAFAYYILFPPAARYLLGVGQDFKLLLKADDYFDFIILIMLAMGLIFQMPAITYVLSRIGIITAGFLLRSWRPALVIILVVAAVVSPTSDIPNMMLFATPMMALYLISIFVAWIFGRERTTS